MMKGKTEIYLSHVSGEVSNITLRGKNIFGDKRLASGERGKNPPAWPAEGAGQGLYRPRRQGHHIADRLLAVKMAIAVDLTLAHLQQIC